MTTYDIDIQTDDDLLDEEDGNISVTVVPGENYSVGASADVTATLPVVDNDDANSNNCRWT